MNSKGKGSSNALITGQNGTRILNQEQRCIGGSGLTSSQICPAPLCRQFWKAGNYDDSFSSKPTHKNNTSYLHIHPKFLHSNATSHKWVFGAIAELVDNAIDEAQNGATFVFIDKCLNPRDGDAALLIQDDGGGMDPEAMRHCLSFGFSDKKSKSVIGKYGNGFKTSTMRLGADVIVFSRSTRNRKLTQTVGLLSYSFLTQAGLDRIVVPMIDYEFKTSTGAWNSLSTEEKFKSNLSLLLQWSPYSTEADLLKQFDDIGDHGTKVIVYNLWLNGEAKMELDFDTDPEDIHNCGNAITEKNRVSESDTHLANRLKFSLRAYLSILYLKVPENFSIWLRRRIIEYHNIAADLKYPEFILYKPQSSGCKEGSVLTTIGFLKEAPSVNHHGFNIYHKNRLILPFWQVVSYSNSRGRGVVGVLEANFIQPTHNKQDFERTALFQKLEARLKEMTLEYWDYHCAYIGYQPVKKNQGSIHPQASQYQPGLPGKKGKNLSSATASEVSKQGSLTPTFQDNARKGAPPKRKVQDHPIIDLENDMVNSAGAIATASQTAEPVTSTTTYVVEAQESVKTNLFRENKKLHSRCLEYEKTVEELTHKADLLQKELKNAKSEYTGLLAESRLPEKGENEKNGVHTQPFNNLMSMLSKYY